MRRRVVLTLALASLAAAPGCVVTPAPGTPAPTAKAPRATAAPTSTPAAAATQAPKATPVPTATPTPAPAPLVAPAGRPALRGTVRIDAGYAVQAGVGQLAGETVSVAPAGLINAGGMNLIAPDGAQVLSHNGGVMVAAGGGNILSHNGGVMVAAGGGNMVAAGGGNLVSAGGLNYRLAQAAAGDGQKPAAGMIVGLLDLATNQLVPVGQDAAGQPAYGAYTDAAGAFTVYPPAELTGNFTVVAVPPTQKADPRLAYGAVASAGQTDVYVDEDSVLAVRVIREAFSTRLAAMMVADDPVKATDEMLGGGGITELLTPSFVRLNTVAKEIGLPAAPVAEREAAAVRMSDILLTTVDLQGMTVRVVQDDRSLGDPQPVIGSLITSFREMRAAADAKLAQDPAFFTQQAWLNGTQVRKGQDLGIFVFENYMKATRPTYVDISNVFRTLKLGTDGKGNYNSYAQTINDCGELIATAVCGVLVTDDGTTAAKLEAALRARRAP